MQTEVVASPCFIQRDHIRTRAYVGTVTPAQPHCAEQREGDPQQRPEGTEMQAEVVASPYVVPRDRRRTRASLGTVTPDMKEIALCAK